MVNSASSPTTLRPFLMKCWLNSPIKQGMKSRMIRTDDSGGILEQLLQTQQAQQADLAIGLDNTYLQTHSTFASFKPTKPTSSGISETALEPYNGPLALPFDRGDVCLNYDETRVDGTNLTVPTSLWNSDRTRVERAHGLPITGHLLPGRPSCRRPSIISRTMRTTRRMHSTGGRPWPTTGPSSQAAGPKPTKSTTVVATANGWRGTSVMQR